MSKKDKVAHGLAIVLGCVTVGCFLAGIWVGDDRWSQTAMVLLCVTFVAGAVSFVRWIES